MTPGGRVAQLFLRYATPLAGVRRWPVVGAAVGWVSTLLVPRDSLASAQVKHGPAAGLWLQLNPRTGRAVLEGGGEPEVQAAVVEHLRRGMTFYDVGANIGFFSLLAARLVGESGHVVAFEADPEIAARLRANAARNALSWITVEPQAVCAEPRDVFFQRADPASSPDRGLGHIVEHETPGVIRVSGVSLDDYTRNAPPPDLIKCDAEGAEVDVFRGAERLLREKRPMVLCEMHSDENRRALEATLLSLGYACQMLDQSHLLALPR